jgi:hypothetical protein
MLLRALFGYNYDRDAYVLRGIGRRFGPVLLEDRRRHREADREPWPDRPARFSEGLGADDGVGERRWVKA